MNDPLIPLPTLTDRLALHHGIPPQDPRLLPAILQTHALANPDYAVPHASLRPVGLADHDARHHPRGLAYRVPHRLRALAHHWSRPGSILAEWSALDLHGLTAFSSGADVTLLCNTDLTLADDPLTATLRRRRPRHKSILLRHGDRAVMVTDRMQTLASCLRSLHNKEHAWDTLADLRTDRVTVMSVQLIDLFCRSFGVSHDDIRTGLAGQFASRTLEKILALSNPLAESRPETILRLLAQEAVVDLPGIHFETQIPLYTDGTIGEPGVIRDDKTLLTIWDVGTRRLRVGLQHDGEHHLQRDQRDKDAEITADIVALDWNQVRTSAGMLRKTSDTKRRIRNAVLGALSRQEAAG